ncbi:MAG: hypothetical protein IH897_10920, partial [Planctomycetes bacterium]|nr:hypothetical protein [Planctomycetota bacterium]
MRRRTAQLAAILGCALYATATNAGLPLGTEFTYQGQLKQGGVPVNSSADFKFTLFQTPDGKDLVETVLVHDVQIVHGLFTVELDFGGNFLQYEARWLEVAVRTPHDATDSLPFTTLAPLHAMTGAPYSLNTRGIQVNDIGNVGIGTDTPEYPLEVMTSGSRAIVSSTFSTSGIALFGRARATSGTNYGVFGQSLSTSGYGVHGVAEADSGLNYGVRGRTNSPDGYAGYFEGGRNFFQGNVGIGTNIPSFPLHVITSSSRAISGKTSGLFGVHGESTGTSGYGVYGINTANTGVNYGVYGACVVGNGVHGHVSATSGSSVGVFGDSASCEGVGVLGEGIATSGMNFGVKGKTRSPDGYAGYFAGGRNYFQGNVGMGTTDPIADLHVVGVSYVSGSLGVGTGAPGALLEIQADQNVSEYLHLSGFDNDSPSTRPVFKFRRPRGSAA